MRTSKSLSSSVWSLLSFLPLAAFCLVSCNSLLGPASGRNDAPGILQVGFAPCFTDAAAMAATGAGPSAGQGSAAAPGSSPADFATKASLPDTDSFIIDITDAKGNSVYNGLFSALPENLPLDAGTYTVSAVSRSFTAPQFDAPQYGDTQVAVVKSGQTARVELVCSQLNAGIRLNINPSFLTDYPNGVLYLNGDGGRLMYSYSERRIAYFKPGNVSITLADSQSQTTLFTRRLEAQQVLVITISTSGASGGTTAAGVSIQIDTTRDWLSQNYTIGGGSDGEDQDDALSVSEARERSGQMDVWVYGYIVGGDLSSSKCSFEPPFVSRTNLVLATKSSCTEKEMCLSVQLAKGKIRDEINLVDNEDLLGRKIWLKGDLVESYYGIPGLQSVTEYKF